MAKFRIQPVLDSLARIITQPNAELNRWQSWIRYAYDLGRYGATQLRRDRAPQMAAALSFRTLFGLLPVMVVAAVMIRAFRGSDEFVALLGRIIEGLGLNEIGQTDNSLGDMLSGLVSQAATYNLAAIGWVGAGVLIYSAISLMVTIENGFNTIYRAPEGRSFIKRVLVYWFVLCFCPIAIAAAIFVNSQVEAWITSIDTWQWVLSALAMMWTFLTTWLIILAVYLLMPNTTMALRPVMIGALVAAVLLGIGRNVLGAYLENAVSISQLYGSLGLIPLFMFWVYLMWLVVLFGLEVSATLQMLHGRTLDKIEQRRANTGFIDPASVVTVMEVIGERFNQALPTSLEHLNDATRIPRRTLEKMLDRLEEEGLLHRLDRDDKAYSLARPPEAITAEQLIDLGFSLVDESANGRRSSLMAALRDAQRSLAAGSTLASLTAPVAPDQVSPG
jgi:membrane protein